MSAAYQTCRKTGPYLPIGKVEWECETHGVELVRVGGEWGTDARRDEMVCPVAFDLDRDATAARGGRMTGHPLGCTTENGCLCPGGTPT